MKIKVRLLLGFFYGQLMFINAIYAQKLKPDNLIIGSEKTAEAFFNIAIGQQSRLYNGASFQGYRKNVKGSANFQDLTTFTSGQIYYDGQHFENIPLMYDLYEDKVIALVGKSLTLMLVSEKVSDFHFNNHHFHYLNALDSVKNNVKPGFFDLIYNGKLKIWVKRTKTLQDNVDGDAVTHYFISKTSYYLERENVFYLFDSKNSFLNLFKDKKKELKQQLKNSKINFKEKPEEAMIILAAYYESLLL